MPSPSQQFRQEITKVHFCAAHTARTEWDQIDTYSHVAHGDRRTPGRICQAFRQYLAPESTRTLLTGTRRRHTRAQGLPVPFDGLFQSDLEAGARSELEVLFGARRIQASTRLPVGLAGVPDDLPFEARKTRDELDEIPDRDLGARSDINRLVPVVSLCREHDPLRGIPRVQELAGRLPGAPHGDRVIARFDRVDALLDQGWNDMGGSRIEIVPRTVEIHQQ